MAKPIVDKTCLLKIFPGKGGWTYVEIPEITPDKKAPFGWVKVKGSIDNYAIEQYKLMPMGNGQLFLPVKASIRKKIGKQVGDMVVINLQLDTSTLKIPQEILLCFEIEEKVLFDIFQALSEGQKKTYLDWIYSAKKEETKANRISLMMKELLDK